MKDTFTVSHLLKLLVFGVIALISYSPSQGQIYSEGFESDMGGFTISGTNPSWIRQTSFKSEGSYAVGTHKNAGDFYSNESSYLTSPVISIPDTDELILMSFMRREVASWAKDGAYMEISTDDGANWTKVYSWLEQGYNDGQYWYGNYTGGGFVFTSADISDYRGMDIRFRFYMKTDGSGGSDGLTFDDIQINYLPDSYAVPTLNLDSISQSDLYVSVDFGVDVTGFDNADVTLGNGTLTSISTLSAAKYQLKIRRITPDVNIDISIRKGAVTSVSGSKPSLSVSDSFENPICYNTSEYEYHLHWSQSLNIAGKVYTEPGTYTDTLVNQVGCDSIMTTKLYFDLPLNEACDAVLQFDGGYETMYNLYMPLTNNSFTLEAWAKADQLGTNRFIFGNGGSTTNKSMHFGYNADGSLKMAFYGNDLNGTENVWDNQWHHYAFTFDATTKVRKIYRDGVEMASDISSSNYLSNYLYIGRGYLYGSQQWDGLIDEVKVWNKALSTSEVNASMKLSDDYSESGLIHAYDFNEGTGTTAYDRIGSENFKFVNMDATNWKNINGGTILSSSNQTITFPSIEAKDVNDPDFELEAYSDSFLPISYTSSDENVATISGNIVTIVGVGSTEITASQSGNSCYDSTGVVRVLEVGNQQAQVITFELQNTASVVDETITLNAISSSGLPVTYTSSNNSVASVLGNILRIRGAGEVAITASQGGSADYEAAPPVIRTLTVTKGSQTITFGALADVAYGDAPFKLLATTNSGLTVIYKSSNESVATIDGNLVSIVGVGTTSITASQLGDENYEAATDVTQDLVINKGAQTISFDALIAKNYGDASFDLSATASSGLGVVYSSSNTSVATISGSTVSIVGIGTTTITASQAGNDNYAAASDVTQDLIINKASQTISFDALIPKSYGDASFDLSATASSGLGVVYSSSNTSVATISGSTVSIVGIGTTTITASQSGNDNYAAASDVTQDLIINKTPQTISFGTLSSKTYGDTSFDLTATASSGLAVSYTSSNTSVATVSGSTVTIVGGGTTTITASQLGDATYAAAPDVAQELVVAQVSQTISFGTLSSKTYGDTSFDLTATASSGLAVSYTSSNTSVATVSGSTITIVGAGTTTITASQSGNSSYTAANSVDQVFTVNKGSQTITFDALASKQVSDTPFDLTATATSGLTVSYVSSNTAVATISGSRVTIVGAGTSTITASQSGNANYSEASPVDQVLTVTKLSQSITFDTLGDQNLIDGTAALSATGGDSGNSITFSSSDDAVASVSGSTLTLNGVGTVTIYANQAGNATYEAASEVSQTFDVFELYIWDGSSWNSGTTPPSNKDLEIASNYSLSSDLEVNNLFINSSSIVEVTDGATLTINSGLTNEGAFYVRSGSSLITYSTTSISGNVTIERTTSYADGRYSFVGSPVQSNEAIIGSDLGGHVYQYDESASSDENSLSRWVDASANVLTPGKGYTQADKQGISFTGIPNDGTITYSGSYVNDGWHLVSNPYPAAIYIDDFLDANTNTTDAVYIWDDNGSNHGRGSNSDYIVANKVGATDVGGIDNSDKWNGFIGSMQGFFVKLDGAAGTIAFTESMRATGNNTDGSYFRTNSEKIPVLRINLTHSDGLKRQTLIGWRSGASNTELEEGYDAKVFSTSGEYQVYTTKSETPLAIQTINYENESIPLTVKVAEAGLYELSIDQLDAQGHILYLLDKSIEEVIDLNEGSYQFQANAGISDRFELIKSMSILGANQLEFVLYAYEKSVYVRQPEGNRTRLKLMSISGQQIWSSDVTSSQKIDFSHLSEGVYILSDGNQSTKIILR